MTDTGNGTRTPHSAPYEDRSAGFRAQRLISRHSDILLALEYAIGATEGRHGDGKSWLDVFADRLEEFGVETVGYRLFTEKEATSGVGHHGFPYEDIRNSPDSYMLSACLWVVMQQCHESRTVLQVRSLLDAISQTPDYLIRALMKSMRQDDDSELTEHRVIARLHIFRRCVELLLFPKIVANPWLVGKSYDDGIFGQHVRNCGIYAPTDSLSYSTSVYDYRQPSEDSDLGGLMTQRAWVRKGQMHMSRVTLFRCLKDLKKAGWVSEIVIGRRTFGRVRFICPNIFLVAGLVEHSRKNAA